MATTPQWSSRFAFLMAAIGSAVGLGNLWRFPFQTGENGGSAFVFVYLLCVVFVAFPILMGELAVGRHKGLSAVGSTASSATGSSAAGSSPVASPSSKGSAPSATGTTPTIASRPPSCPR